MSINDIIPVIFAECFLRARAQLEAHCVQSFHLYQVETTVIHTLWLRMLGHRQMGSSPTDTSWESGSVGTPAGSGPIVPGLTSAYPLCLLLLTEESSWAGAVPLKTKQN